MVLFLITFRIKLKMHILYPYVLGSRELIGSLFQVSSQLSEIGYNRKPSDPKRVFIHSNSHQNIGDKPRVIGVSVSIRTCLL